MGVPNVADVDEGSFPWSVSPNIRDLRLNAYTAFKTKSKQKVLKNIVILNAMIVESEYVL